MTDTQSLLAEYVQTGSDSAFRELVTRYVNLVYSTALRLVDGDTHRAQDVAQIVFADLAKKAGELSPDVMLGGWLHRHTCFVATNSMRSERRRLAREREAAEMNSLPENAGADFSQLAPILDETINHLMEADRAAILLRFFEQKDFRAVGQTLDSSEDAARMRVNRALEKLRDLLAKHGIRTTAGALSIAISANAVQSAPTGLATTISATTASTIIATTAKTIAMTTLQKTLVTATVTVLAGAGVYEARQAVQLRDQVRTLQQQQAPLAEQIHQLQQERDNATNQVAALLAEDELLKSNSNENELLKLRGEVTQLRTANTQNDSNDPTDEAAKDVAAKVKQMKQWLEQNPNKKIPELQYLTAQEWLRGANYSGDLKTDDDFARALSQLRRDAKRTFAYSIGAALANYVAANNGQLPGDISQLGSYFNPPVDGTILQRYQLLQTGNLSDIPNNEPLIAEKAPVDEQYDSLFKISTTGYSYQGTGTAYVNGSGKGGFGTNITAKIKPFERQN